MKISFCFALASASASILLLLSPEALALDPPPGGGYPDETTALGEDALFSLPSDTTGRDTAIGFETLYNCTSGSENTAVGDHALYSDTTGGANTGLGFYALSNNTTGTFSVAVGEFALAGNISGGGSVGVGDSTLSLNTTGYGNVAVGFSSMASSLTGSYNTAVGNVTLAFNASGSENTAVGDGAMNQSSGSSNVAIGRSAGLNFAGSGNIAIGEYAGQSVAKGSNAIEIGNQGEKKDDSLIRIGDIKTQKKAFIAGINGVTVSSGVAVVVDKMGQLGVMTSSARFKENIAPMKEASDVLLSLQPVTFRYKKELDSSGTPQFGLVAEDVAKVDPDLVARDDSGQPYTVRYEAVNAMLLNEFLKEHRNVEADHATIAGQQQEIAELKAAVTELKSQVQRVSAQVQANAPAPRLAGVGGE